MKQKKAYQYRMYPTQEQAHILARTFGCCRYAYNWALRARTDAFFQRGERLYYNQLAVLLTDLKKQEETAWLSEVSSVPLQQALRHLDRAFRNFFEGRAEYPTFHKKHGVQAATYAANAFTLPVDVSIGQNAVTTWEELSALLFALPGWSKAGFNARSRAVRCALLRWEKCSCGTGELRGLHSIRGVPHLTASAVPGHAGMSLSSGYWAHR